MLPFHCIFSEDVLFNPMKMKGDGSCLYLASASHIMSFFLDDIWTDRFPPGKKPGIKLAIFEVVNDLKELISQKHNDILQNYLTCMQIKESITLSK